MKLSKKRITLSWSRIIFFCIVFLVLIWFIFFSGIIKKNCKQDKDCFNEAFNSCKPSKFINIIDNNIYDYIIKGKQNDFCKVYIKLRATAVGTPIETKNKLEGKDMTCFISLEDTKNSEINKIKDLLNKCSGTLKEAKLEIIINRLYGLIIGNFDKIVEQINKEKLFNI